MASKPRNLTVRKGAVLINRREVEVFQWLQYLRKNFDKLTADLNDATILILAGRHGEEDGSIGIRDVKVFENHEKMVKITISFYINKKISNVLSFRWRN